jgi:hypothetical protein
VETFDGFYNTLPWANTTLLEGGYEREVVGIGSPIGNKGWEKYIVHTNYIALLL